jgi:hypothetical protein
MDNDSDIYRLIGYIVHPVPPVVQIHVVVEIHLSLNSDLPNFNKLASPDLFNSEPNIHLSLNFYGFRSFISELC